MGVACAIIATRALESQLFGIRPTDPLTYGTVGLVVVATALLAGYLPARRAARVGPLVGIRSE